MAGEVVFHMIRGLRAACVQLRPLQAETPRGQVVAADGGTPIANWSWCAIHILQSDFGSRLITANTHAPTGPRGLELLDPFGLS